MCPWHLFMGRLFQCTSTLQDSAPTLFPNSKIINAPTPKKPVTSLGRKLKPAGNSGLADLLIYLWASEAFEPRGTFL